MDKQTQAAAAPAATAPAMSAEEACKRVKRLVVEEDGGQRREKRVALKPAEVLAVRDHGTHVVVVTADGQKFSSAEA